MKNLKIIILVLGIIIIGVGVYFGFRYFFSSPINIKEGVPTTTANNQMPQVTTASNNMVFDYWLNKKTGEIFYLTDNGQIYKISSAGEEQGTGSRATGNLNYIKPSQDGSSLLISFGYPKNSTFAVYNTAAKNWLALPANTTAAAWDPKSDNRLIYLKDGGNTSRLNFLTLSNGKSQELLQLSQKDLDLEWVLPDVIYLKERPSNKIGTSLWSYNLSSKTIEAVAKEETGLVIKWVDNGKMGLKLSNGLFFVIDSKNKLLSLVDLLTLPSKCDVSSERLEMYCAAPSLESLSTNIIKNLPDEYLKKDLKFKDTIYLIPIDLLGQSKLLTLKFSLLNALPNNKPIDADHLEIFNNQLLFINRYDKKLYSLEL